MSKSVKKVLVPVLAILGLLLVLLAIAGYFREKIEPGLADFQAVDTDDALVVVETVAAVFETVPASVEAKETTIISSRLLARITAINVRAGDYVEEGALLVELEQSDLQARAQQAQDYARSVNARWIEASKHLERTSELHARGLIAQAAKDTARANAAALEADLSSARQAQEEALAALAYSKIRAPMAGRVVDRFAEPGDTAAPGSKLLSLYNPFSLRVEARVREQLALALEKGMALQVEVPALGTFYEARIEEIVPAADPGSRSFLVKARLPSVPGLLPGLYARLQVPAGERSRLLIPQDAVAQVGQLDVVWVVVSDRVVRRFVRLGRTAEGQVEVISGLRAGDAILPIPPQ
ncbi:MAG: efflux RND transporter periplasmic adaptor subunit [Gammaproteobacteria bacterium]|nr:efflux RND transporter periplasmic adaptor subunit [Gammaproteobacteria bacterium]